MTPHDPAATWTWTGDRNLPDWITHHHWHADRPVINTADGPRTLYDGWMAILWTDGAITVASAAVAERVYGPDGIAGRLKRAEAATDGELRRQLAAAIAALGKSETELAALRAVAQRAEAAIDRAREAATHYLHEYEGGEDPCAAAVLAALDQPGPATAQATEPATRTKEQP